MADFYKSNEPEPHVGRLNQILKAHPEVLKLMGPTKSSFFLIIAIVSSQFAIAFAVKDQPIWMMLLAAFLVGAVLQHSLFVMIHECAHNLVWKNNTNFNRFMGIIANSPGVFSSAIGFRNFHLLHHRFQGELGWDADLAGPLEAKIVGNSTIMKALWLLTYPITLGVIRPARLKKNVTVLEPWTILNFTVVTGAAAAVWYFWGLTAFLYLAASLFMSIGLHPLGGRWIQEHFIFHPPQETSSYYGPLNLVAFNVGYHNEHHDFMGIAWNKLPKLRAMAPEHYDTLHYHTSWTKCLLSFIFNKNFSLYSRYVRPDHDEKSKGNKKPFTTKETQVLTDQTRHERIDSQV